MTARTPTEELFSLRVTRVDLVDAGDNPEAHVTLYKRKPEDDATKKGTPMACPNCSKSLPTNYGNNGQELAKYCPDCGAKIKLSSSGGETKKGVDVMAELDLSKLEAAVREPIEEHVKALDEELAAEKTRATDFEAKAKKAESDLKVEKSRADKATTELDAFKKAHPAEDEDVLKGIPDEIRKRLEDTEAEVAKMKEDAEVVDYTKRAEVLDCPGTKPAKLGPILRRIAKGKSTEDDLKEVERLMKGAIELAKKGGLTKGLGASGDPSHAETAWDEAVEKGRALVSEGKAANLPAAMSLVWKQHPDLDKRVQAEKHAR